MRLLVLSQNASLYFGLFARQLPPCLRTFKYFRFGSVSEYDDISRRLYNVWHISISKASALFLAAKCTPLMVYHTMLPNGYIILYEIICAQRMAIDYVITSSFSDTSSNFGTDITLTFNSFSKPIVPSNQSGNIVSFVLYIYIDLF